MFCSLQERWQKEKIPILELAREENYEGLEEYISSGRDLDVLNEAGDNALLFACLNGLTEVARILIKGGANLDIQFKDFGSVLMAACYRRRGQIAKLLIEGGADLNLKDKYGRSALMAALATNMEEQIEVLIQKGANVNTRDAIGATPLTLAIESDSNVELILSREEMIPFVRGKHILEFIPSLKAFPSMGNFVNHTTLKALYDDDAIPLETYNAVKRYAEDFWDRPLMNKEWLKGAIQSGAFKRNPRAIHEANMLYLSLRGKNFPKNLANFSAKKLLQVSKKL